MSSFDESSPENPISGEEVLAQADPQSLTNTVSGKNDNLSSFVSQTDYIPTPYSKTAWEGMDSYDLHARFHGITLDVITSGEFRIDPMFQVFQSTLETETFQQLLSETSVIEDSEPEIPEALLEGIREEAFSLGVQEGIRQAEEEMSLKLSKVESQYEKKFLDLKNSISTKLNEKATFIEKRAVELALAVSSKILETTVEVKPEYIYEIIRKAIYSVPGAKKISIHLSPEDYEFLKIEGVPNDITELPIAISYHADDSIVSGCIINSEFGTINLEIDAMWDEIRQNLFSVVS